MRIECIEIFNFLLYFIFYILTFSYIRAIQEIDAERIRVSVRDHEIEHLRSELVGHAPFSLSMSQAKSFTFNSVEETGTTAADGEGVSESARRIQSGHQALSVEVHI